MKLRRRESKKARIEIIPMIDVIFFLLVFFMVSSLAMTKVNSVQVALPKTSSSAQSLKQKIILSVKKTGEIFVNQTSVSLSGVGAALADAMKGDPQEVVLVNADEGANYGLVIKAMDQARIIGVRKFALATDPSPVK
jgi:biopolymer transport protein ExbD